jgi:mRNA-degrading endonuclease RelE of RelBE toxin-antitoxin system
MRVTISAEAFAAIEALHEPMHRRILAALERLQNWPSVSGAKPLRGELKGCFRVRCGDWRIVFRPRGDDSVYVLRIDNRRDVYE